MSCPENHVCVPIKAPDALLRSMAMRYNHGFQFLDSAAQKSILTTMRQLYEEVVGEGFYKSPDKIPESEKAFAAWLSKTVRVDTND